MVCTVRWSDHFPCCEGRRWTHYIPTCILEYISPKSHAFRVGRKDLVLGREQEEDPDHRQVFGRYLLGHHRIFRLARLLVVCRTVKRRPREDAADPVFFNSIRGTSRRLLPDDEPREPREPREQPSRIVQADLHPPVSTESFKTTRVHPEFWLSCLDTGTPWMHWL